MLAEGVKAFGGITEPAHGSDILLLDTTAVRNGDKHIINGTKTFQATYAKFGTVLTQTKPELRHRGQSVFIIDLPREGVEITPIKGLMGYRANPIGEISFSDVEVSKDDLLGVENRGFYMTMEELDIGRVAVACEALGMAEGAFDKAIGFTSPRCTDQNASFNTE